MQIAGSSVLLTGASGGIGRALACDLRARGAELLVTGRREEELRTLAGELGARAVIADLAERADVERLAREAARADILVANAALPAASRLEALSLLEMDRVLDVNLRSAIALTHALLPGMLERRRGHLVYISSTAGKTTVPGNPLYHATKFALRGFAAGLRQDLHGSGVGVSCIFPGFIRDAGLYAESGARLPPGTGTRSPEDVARAVAKAIERDIGELDVAAFPQRAGAVFASLFPELGARIVRRAGGQRIALEMEQGLKAKR